ncbi:MAG: hypothetical protein FJ039_10200 [Chloroflexi bacterium]|nr:hypothetical protein [Chloroflexota bacterium]
MVTVGYEQARGMRGKHERPDGYSVSKSITLEVPVAKAYAAWRDDSARAAWLQNAPLATRTANPNKIIRASWAGGASNIDVNFYSKGPSKCQVVVRHNRLASQAVAGKMKSYWAEQLAALKASFGPSR